MATLILFLWLNILLRRYGHVLRKDDDDWVKKCMEHEVEGQDQGEDQRRPGKKLYVRTVKHVS